MPLVLVKMLADLAAGSMTEFEQGDSTFAVCNVAGSIYCVDGVCPHAQGPLAQGALHAATVVCPWHGWEFDVRTGFCESGDDCRLTTYPTMVKDGQIFIELTERVPCLNFQK